MSHSLRVSDALFESAKATGEALTRSVAQQVEHWARLGQAVEAKGLDVESIRSLLESGDVRVATGDLWQIKRDHQSRDRDRVASMRVASRDMHLIDFSQARSAVVLNGPY